jgi:surface antigen
VTAPQPAAPYRAPVAFDRSYCRAFTSRVTIDAREVVTYGTACRQPDGTWRVVN